MNYTPKGRYSKYLRGISLSLDLLALNGCAYLFFQDSHIHWLTFLAYLNVAWVIDAIITKFYAVYRFTTPVEILAKNLRQLGLFVLLVIAYFPFERDATFSGSSVIGYILTLFGITILFKYLFFYYLKKYRIVTGNNFRKVIIIGHTDEAQNLRHLFETRIDYGYRFMGFFSDKAEDPQITGSIKAARKFVLENKIDEMFCSLSEISNSQLKQLVEFSDIHRVSIKFIPDTKEILSKNLTIDYYALFPVLSMRKTLLHEPWIKVFKRSFDIVFSLLVIVFILSWLTPIFALLIKLESRGPVFFKQGRPGLDENEFLCYKFRSMRINKTPEKEASKDDPRVTRIGRFIRKTSLDELPQFFNVLKGDMSVVGPRPHLWSQNIAYGKKIKKYMMRHYVKPGITGLAQVRGYRGEITRDDDMVNRIKYDVFYIENWSFLLDVKIIVQTVINIFKGEEKAY